MILRKAFIIVSLSFVLGLQAAISLNSSVLVFHAYDFKKVKEQIDKAIALGNKKLNFVVTLHHMANTETHRIEKLCYDAGDGELCKDLDKDVLKYIFKKHRENFLYAAQKGLDISVVPHLDDGRKAGMWRNNLVFDPIVKAGPYSYSEAMIWPLAVALKAAAEAGSKVDFALQGESGATVFHHAYSYRQVIRHLRNYFGKLPVRVGLSLNFNFIAGHHYVKNEEQTREVEKLLAEIDFLGLSAYNYVGVPVRATDFNNSIVQFLKEFADFGIEIPAELPFRFSEVGLGGGTVANNGQVTAQTPEEAAAAPYSGRYGDYSAEIDPWTKPEMRQFRFDFHKALLEYLSTPELQLRKLESCFLWNSNSWDPQGLYFENNAYRDDAIVELIRDYNLQR